MNFIEHLLQTVFCLVIVVGPLPLCLAVVRLLTPHLNHGLPEKFLVLICGWFLFQAPLVLSLGFAGGLRLPFILGGEVILWLAGWAVLRSLHRHLAQATYFQKRDPFTWMEILTLGALLLLCLNQLYQALSEVIIDYDSLAYHLPVVSTWYQNGSITYLQVHEYLDAAFYPFTWELTSLLFFMPLQEDLFITLPNFAAWVCLGLSVFLIALELGAKRAQAIAGAALVLVTPSLITNLNSLHVDLAVAACFTTACYLAFLFVRSRSILSLGLFLGLLGLLPGIKVSGAIYSGFLLATLALVYFWPQQSPAATRPPGTVSLLVSRRFAWLFLAIGLFVSGCWFLKGWYQIEGRFGNPLKYCDALGSFMDRASLTSLTHLLLSSPFSQWSAAFGKLAPELSIPMATAFILALGLIPGLFTTRQPEKIKSSLLLLWLACGTGAIYLCTPYSARLLGPETPEVMAYNVRFAFAHLATLGIAAALGAIMLKLPKNLVLLVALIVVVYSMVAQHGYYWPMLLLAAVLLLILPVLLRFRPQWSLITLAFLLMLSVFPLRHQREEHRRETYGPVVRFISEEIPESQTVGYLLSHKSYLFRGKNLARKVCFLPSRSNDPEEWIAGLREEGIDFVVAGPIHSTWKNEARWNYAREIAWLQDPNGPFKRIIGENFRLGPVLFKLTEPLPEP